MSLVVNTNVSSLTAQRALAYADSLQKQCSGCRRQQMWRTKTTLLVWRSLNE